MTQIRLIVLSVGICLFVSLTWLVNHYRDNATEYKKQRDEKSHQLGLANDTITDMQTRQRDVAALDVKYTRELADALTENSALQLKLDSGGSVHVKGKCPVPAKAQAASTSGVGDDATVELSADSGRNVLGIRAGIISDQTALRALQEYIHTQCLQY